MIGIYKIISPSGKIYIGQSRDLKRRKNDYEKYIKNSNRQIKLLASINKYGWESHVFEIIEECLFEDLNKRERYFQELYNSVDSGLNCIYTKTDEKPAIFGKESRDKMRNSRYGKKASLETRQKMSEKRKGFIFSEEVKLKMSKAALGKPKNISEQSKKRMSEKIKIRLSKPISCISPEGIYFEFSSFKEAALYIGVAPQSIQQAVSKKRNCKKWSNFKLIEIVKNK